MSRWIEIIKQHRAQHNFGQWGGIPESHYSLIARQCGPAELADIRSRLDDLNRQAAEIPDWDGDSQDDSWRARQLFAAILAYHSYPSTIEGNSE